VRRSCIEDDNGTVNCNQDAYDYAYNAALNGIIAELEAQATAREQEAGGKPVGMLSAQELNKRLEEAKP